MNRTRKGDRAPYVPIDQRDPKTVRAVILAQEWFRQRQDRGRG
jgi:hypothetical protein